MKTKKQVFPFLCVLALSFLASKPFLDKNVGPLSQVYPKESLTVQSDDEEGWSIIRYKIFFPTKPDLPSKELDKQEELLAYYGE